MNLLRIKGVVLQDIYYLRHSTEDLIDVFFWPSVDLVIWGLMTTYFIQLKGPVSGIVAFLLGGLILWNIVWRAQQDISLAFLKNIWNGNIINLFSSPLTPGEFVVATMITGFFKIILTLTLVTLMAFVLYSFNLFSLGFYFIPFFINLIIFAWASGIFIIGLIVRYGMRVQAFAWSLIVLIQPVSAVFYPVSVLPPFLQKVALFLPTAHIFEGMREVLSSGTLSGTHLLWAFALNGVFLIFSSRFFIFMFEKAREKGKIAKVEM